MNEQQFLQTTAKVMTDKTPLSLTIRIQDAWLLVSGLQLATRHPGVTDQMKELLEAIARQFQGAIVQAHPEAHPLLEMGWDSTYDMESEGEE